MFTSGNPGDTFRALTTAQVETQRDLIVPLTMTELSELRGRIKTPEGEVELRFVGVDGPRWLVRAVFQGPAALDPAAAPLLLDSLHGLVVDRGREAMPVMDVLPLRLPREIAEQARVAFELVVGNEILQGIKEFKKASSDVTNEFHNAMNQEPTPPPRPPAPKPLASAESPAPEATVPKS